MGFQQAKSGASAAAVVLLLEPVVLLLRVRRACRHGMEVIVQVIQESDC